MKRTFFLLMVLAVSTSIFAELTRKCWITLASNQGGSDVVKLYENSDRNHSLENSYDATKNMNTAYDFSVNIYVRVPQYIPNDSLGTVMTNNIERYPITIKTNKLTDTYTMTFSNLLGEIYLYDAQIDSLMLMEEGGTYDFVAPINKIVSDRFFINRPFDPTICHQYGNLIITGHKGEKVKVLDMAGEVAIAEQTLASNNEVISLSALTKGEKYQVIVGDKTMIIRVQ